MSAYSRVFINIVYIKSVCSSRFTQRATKSYRVKITTHIQKENGCKIIQKVQILCKTTTKP